MDVGGEQRDPEKIDAGNKLKSHLIRPVLVTVAQGIQESRGTCHTKHTNIYSLANTASVPKGVTFLTEISCLTVRLIQKFYVKYKIN
jgi:hypothetical protein